MATDDYQTTWRGARRYQFDEEARRKAAARTKRRRLKTTLAALLLTGAAGAGYLADDLSSRGLALIQTIRLSSGMDCWIKGNVSIETGERIYHVPGQKYYLQTRVSPRYGERWFCSEADARAAGWRRSRT